MKGDTLTPMQSRVPSQVIPLCQFVFTWENTHRSGAGKFEKQRSQAAAFAGACGPNRPLANGDPLAARPGQWHPLLCGEVPGCGAWGGQNSFGERGKVFAHTRTCFTTCVKTLHSSKGKHCFRASESGSHQRRWLLVLIWRLAYSRVAVRGEVTTLLPNRRWRYPMIHLYFNHIQYKK